MKKSLSAVSFLLLFALCLSLAVPGISACAEEKKDPAEIKDFSGVADASQMTTVEDVVEEGMTPLYASSLLEGAYPVTVDCSSSMFRIAECLLTVQGGAISARLTMGGKSYGWVYPGTAQEAAAADHADHIPAQFDENGATVFEIPVQGLDMGIPCAAFSLNKELWYDRTLVFRSDSLPLSAFADGVLMTPASLQLADGVYSVEVSLTGGSGKARVESPARLTVSDGVCTAEIVWGSKNYDYMKVEGVQYFPINTEGNSAFEIPVTVFDRPMAVIADTVAMSQPHEISYSLLFDSSSLLPVSVPAGSGEMPLSYAQQFSVTYEDDGSMLVTVAGRDRFRLLSREADDSCYADDIPIIRIPVRNVCLASSSVADLFLQLDALDAIRLSSTAASGWRLPAVADAMEQEAILYAGKYSAPDYELILTENCDLVIENTMILHSPAVREKLEMLGLPVLVEYSSYEPHPLGRVEWIKLYGLLTGREKEAVRFFEEQVASLASLQDLEKTGKKAAFFYIGSNGSVIVRKPSDYVSKMIELAGGTYPFTDIPDDGTALSTMNMQMESFFAQAKDCDVLIYNSTVDGGISSLEELVQKSPLLAEFDAVRNGQVWCSEQDMFQQTSAAAGMILDFNAVFTGADTSSLRYLRHVES